jgi:hypothetical protein
VSFIRHCDNDELCSRGLRVTAADDPTRAFEVGILGGDFFGSLGTAAADHDVVPSCSEPSGQTTALWSGPAQDSDLHPAKCTGGPE